MFHSNAFEWETLFFSVTGFAWCLIVNRRCPEDLLELTILTLPLPCNPFCPLQNSSLVQLKSAPKENHFTAYLYLNSLLISISWRGCRRAWLNGIKLGKINFVVISGYDRHQSIICIILEIDSFQLPPFLSVSQCVDQQQLSEINYEKCVKACFRLNFPQKQNQWKQK